MPKDEVGIYLAGGDSFCSVLTEMNSFICSKLPNPSLQLDDASILGKISWKQYRDKVAGHVLDNQATDQDAFLKDVGSWIAKRFFGDKAKAKYSVERRCWEIWA
jgi:hypothetical protein